MQTHEPEPAAATPNRTAVTSSPIRQRSTGTPAALPPPPRFTHISPKITSKLPVGLRRGEFLCNNRETRAFYYVYYYSYSRRSAEQHGRTPPLYACSKTSLAVAHHQRGGEDNHLPLIRELNSRLVDARPPARPPPPRTAVNNPAAHLVPQRVQFVDGLKLVS